MNLARLTKGTKSRAELEEAFFSQWAVKFAEVPFVCGTEHQHRWAAQSLTHSLAAVHAHQP